MKIIILQSKTQLSAWNRSIFFLQDLSSRFSYSTVWQRFSVSNTLCVPLACLNFWIIPNGQSDYLKVLSWSRTGDLLCHATFAIFFLSSACLRLTSKLTFLISSSYPREAKDRTEPSAVKVAFFQRAQFVFQISIKEKFQKNYTELEI